MSMKELITRTASCSFEQMLEINGKIKRKKKTKKIWGKCQKVSQPAKKSPRVYTQKIDFAIFWPPTLPPKKWFERKKCFCFPQKNIGDSFSLLCYLLPCFVFVRSIIYGRNWCPGEKVFFFTGFGCKTKKKDQLLQERTQRSSTTHARSGYRHEVSKPQQREDSGRELPPAAPLSLQVSSACSQRSSTTHARSGYQHEVSTPQRKGSERGELPPAAPLSLQVSLNQKTVRGGFFF